MANPLPGEGRQTQLSGHAQGLHTMKDVRHDLTLCRVKGVGLSGDRRTSAERGVPGACDPARTCVFPPPMTVNA